MENYEFYPEFTYDSSEFIALAYTIKKLTNEPSKAPTEAEYWWIIEGWGLMSGVTLYQPYFERDSHGKLHIHGVVVVRKNFYKKRLTTDGYSTYLTDIYDFDGWIRYISKCNQYEQDDMYSIIANQ